MKTELLLAITDSEWELALGREVSTNSSFKIGRRCVDLAEVLTMLQVKDFKLAIISSEVNNLDLEVVTEIERKSCLLIGVFKDGDYLKADRLSELGIKHVLGFNEINPSNFFTNLMFCLNQKLGIPEENSSGAVIPGLISVWGTSGAPGRTTLAIDIASALQQVSSSCLLIDADVTNPSIASALGLAEDISGVSAAIHLAQSGKLSRESLFDCVKKSKIDLSVLTGILNPDRWIEIRPSGLQKLLEYNSEIFSNQVVDLNSILPDTREGTYPEFDSNSRFSHVRTILDFSEKVIFVVKASPLGVIRAAEVLQNESGNLLSKTSVIVNQVNDYSFGINGHELIKNVLQRFVPVNQIWSHLAYPGEYAKSWISGTSGYSLINNSSELSSLINQLKPQRVEMKQYKKEIRSVA